MKGNTMAGAEKNMIPVRTPISRLQASQVARYIAEKLTAQWGLANAKRISGEIMEWMKAEGKRREKLPPGS
jgi:hypothetical protein